MSKKLLADFIGIAGRYLEGSANNPKFKPIVAWALQNIQALRRMIGPPELRLRSLQDLPGNLGM